MIRIPPLTWTDCAMEYSLYVALLPACLALGLVVGIILGRSLR